jgi:hypothetical protein
MGQSISAVREAAVQQNKELEKTANDSLTALQDLAKLQVELFKAQVTSVSTIVVCPTLIRG